MGCRAERRAFHLLGLLPYQVAQVGEQLARTYENYCRENTDLGRYLYLASLHDRNEVLFYRLVLDHIREMSPIVYTPVVGLALNGSDGLRPNTTFSIRACTDARALGWLKM